MLFVTWNGVMQVGMKFKRHGPWIDGWITFGSKSVLFKNVSVVSRRWTGDNEMLCAMGPHFLLKRYFRPKGFLP